MLVNIHYWQAVGRQRGIKMSTREMKDHTPLLTPLKASDQSRTIGELKLKKQNQTKHSSLHPGYTLCPRLTHGSSLGQHGQQEMVERGFTQNTSYVALSVCSLLSYQVHNSLSIFYLAVHFFTYNPKPQSPRDRRTWVGGYSATQWNADTPVLSFPMFSLLRANRLKKHWYSDPTWSFKCKKKKKSVKITGYRVKLPGSNTNWVTLRKLLSRLQMLISHL